MASSQTTTFAPRAMASTATRRRRSGTSTASRRAASTRPRAASSSDDAIADRHVSSSAPVRRRDVAAALLASSVALSTVMTSPSSSSAATMPDSEPTGLDANGRLRRCPSNFNCVSTSSIGGAPEQYGTAWTAKTATVDDAVAQVAAAVSRACGDQGARRVESVPVENGHYLRFEMDGKLGKDNVEFFIKNEGIGDRNGWEGDAGREKEFLVLYRSLATTVKYVYPFTTPVSDFGEQKKRMERIRGEVGWRRVGCELEECELDL